MKIIITLILLSLIIFFSWHYIFSIYEIKYKLNKKNLKPGETLIIEIIPLNSFGKKIPFRDIPFKVEINNDKNLVLSELFTNVTKIELKEEGNYELKLKSEYDMFPTLERVVVE